MVQTAESTHPEKTFRAGLVSASVFRNSVTVGDEERLIPKVTFQKRYKKPDGKWATTGSLDVHEIPKAVLVLGQAYEYLVGRETSGKRTDPKADDGRNSDDGDPTQESAPW